MSPDARDSDQRPLFGLDGRIPTVQAVTLTRQSGLTTLRKGWLPRHSAAMILLSPALFLMYKSALAAGLDGPAFLLNQATGPLGGALALAVLGLGLTQRLSGTSACS